MVTEMEEENITMAVVLGTESDDEVIVWIKIKAS